MEIPLSGLNYPQEWTSTRDFRIALSDFLTRKFHGVCAAAGYSQRVVGGGWKSGKGGDISICNKLQFSFMNLLAILSLILLYDNNILFYQCDRISRFWKGVVSMLTLLLSKFVLVLDFPPEVCNSLVFSFSKYLSPFVSKICFFAFASFDH